MWGVATDRMEWDVEEGGQGPYLLLGECLQHDGDEGRCGLLNELHVHWCVLDALSYVVQYRCFAVAHSRPEFYRLHSD